MKPNNYVKLSIRDARRYHDADAVPQAPSSATYPLVPHDYPVSPTGEDRLYVTTWVFPFVEDLEGDAHRALAAAEAKREDVMSNANVAADRFRFTTYLPSRLGQDAVFPVEGEEL
jgi:hypothetical protein